MKLAPLLMLPWFLLSQLLVSTPLFAGGQPSACAVMLVGDHSRAEEYAVHTVVAPETVEELQRLVRTTHRPIAVRGAGFSMGGQTAVADGVVVDMKNLNKVLAYNPQDRTLSIQAGATWQQIQKLIDKDNLAVKIMQSYNNFQVGGSLSVNAHGRYMGYGPLIASVIEIQLLLSDGSIVTASREVNSELFSASIGGYAALGIILSAKLQLVDNSTLERKVASFSNSDIETAVHQFLGYFDSVIAQNPNVEMINGDIYPPDYGGVTCITYEKTDKRPTIADRLQSPAARGWRALRSALRMSLEQVSVWVKRLRGRWIAPKELGQQRVVRRNYEAGYDNAELMSLNDRIPALRWLPFSNRKTLLQEYFIPKAKLAKFIAKMKRIFLEHGVNVSNVSLRHVPQNTESMLSWSSEESFAVVVYYTQPYGRNRAARLEEAKSWTRKMVAEVEAVGGSFYLPYQVHATRDQFLHAYPRHDEFFELKRKYDPEGRFNNNLWDQYLLTADTYHFRDFANTDHGRRELEDYFTYIFSINDPHRFISAIELAMTNTRRHNRDLNDRNIYDELLNVLPQFANGRWAKIKSTLSALRVQQAEMARQTAEALGNVGVSTINGYVEVGTPGRYVLPLRRLLSISGPIYVVNPSFSAADAVETSFGVRVPASLTSRKVLLSDYDAFRQDEIATESVDLVTMYIGLHHCPVHKLPAFVASIARVLRTGGKFVLRDHDADDKLRAMAWLAHATYNAGLGIAYGEELREIRNLHPLSYWKALLAEAGLKWIGSDILQSGDPTGNTLMVFEKVARTPEVEEEIRTSLMQMEASFTRLNLLPGFHRDQSNTYMTQAEWFLVDMFQELSRFLAQTPIYEFPFDDFIALFDEVYTKHKAFAELEGVIDGKAFLEYDQMDRFLLFGMKGLFKSMKWLSNSTPREDTPEGRAYFVSAQKVLADFFADYAQFMTHTPWYEFQYGAAKARLRACYEGNGDCLVPEATHPYAGAIDRGMLRRANLVLRALSLSAGLVKRFMGSQVSDASTQFLIEADADVVERLRQSEIPVTELGNERFLVRTGRYMPFTMATRQLAGASGRILNVAGNTHIAVIFKSRAVTLPTFSVGTIPTMRPYQYPTHELPGGCSDYFHTVRVAVGDLPQLLSEAQAKGLELLRVHDY